MESIHVNFHKEISKTMGFMHENVKRLVFFCTPFKSNMLQFYSYIIPTQLCTTWEYSKFQISSWSMCCIHTKSCRNYL